MSTTGILATLGQQSGPALLAEAVVLLGILVMGLRKAQSMFAREGSSIADSAADSSEHEARQALFTQLRAELERTTEQRMTLGRELADMHLTVANLTRQAMELTTQVRLLTEQNALQEEQCRLLTTQVQLLTARNADLTTEIGQLRDEISRLQTPAPAA